jgi:uncharacterized membrane protein YqaE (UPF0057 family)
MRKIIVAIGAILLLSLSLFLETGRTVNTIELTALEWIPGISVFVHVITHFSTSLVFSLF